MTKAQRSPVEEAAYTWWKSRRPMHWYEPDHVNNPTINCGGPAECWLAEAVASMVEAEPYKAAVEQRDEAITVFTRKLEAAKQSEMSQLTALYTKAVS